MVCRLPCLRTIKRTRSGCGRVLLRLLLLPRLLNVLRLASMRGTVKAWRLMSSGWMVGGRLLFLMRSALGLALLAAFVCLWGLRVVLPSCFMGGRIAERLRGVWVLLWLFGWFVVRRWCHEWRDGRRVDRLG